MKRSLANYCLLSFCIGKAELMLNSVIFQQAPDQTALNITLPLTFAAV
jgi:hypothetical protein